MHGPSRSDGEDHDERESSVFRSILQSTTPQEFFENTWQKEPKIFRLRTEPPTRDCARTGGDGAWNDDSMKRTPFEEILHQRWHVLKNLLEQMEDASQSQTPQDSQPAHQVPEKALLFLNREIQTQAEAEELYGGSLFAAYLNGCSVVINHCDLRSPWIAALCQDLQESFPHAYANSYLTPPDSQAVPAHADDRDVLVFQIAGSKNWQVYQNVPIPFPYPQEQVGKDGQEVPKEVLEGPIGLSTTLRPGDVLYMPRGFVHQASCGDSLSFHVTVALATHDWSMAGMMAAATRNILMQNVEFRKSLLPVRSASAVEDLQKNIDAALQMIQEEVTAKNMLAGLHTKLERHNRRAYSIRMNMIHKARFPTTPPPSTTSSPQPIFGPEAVKFVSYDTFVRATTPEERSQIAVNSSKPRGLHVREEIADAIMGIVSKLKSNISVQIRVLDLRLLMAGENQAVCDLALLSLAKRAVELGAFAIADNEKSNV